MDSLSSEEPRTSGVIITSGHTVDGEQSLECLGYMQSSGLVARRGRGGGRGRREKSGGRRKREEGEEGGIEK